MYIAVCDDQAEELEQLMDLLDLWQRERRTALRFRSFRSAAELLDAAEKEPFTLYLLDVMMPGMWTAWRLFRVKPVCSLPLEQSIRTSS